MREAGPQRLALTALLLFAALLLARFSWTLPFTGVAESALYDSRVFEMADRVEQDQRVVMVVYNDDTLINLRKRSPLDRGVLADALRNLDDMGAKAIGIDIFFDQPQDEDEVLIQTLQNMQTPVSVAYSESATNEDSINWAQEQYLREFMAALDGSNSRPASVRLEQDLGVTRTWPKIYPELPPLLGRSMLLSAGDEALTLPGYEGMVRYQLPSEDDRGLFPRFTIDVIGNADLLAIPELGDAIREQIAGSYVLIGGELQDIDRVLTPFTSITGEEIPGLEWHAITIAQMLDNARPAQPSIWYLWAFTLLAVITGGLTALLEVKSWKFIPLFVGQLAIFVGLPFFLHARGMDTYGFPAVGPALGWIMAFAAVVSAARAAGAVQRKFAQGALGKYLPQSIADEIIEKPELLALGGAKREIYVIFSDLEGFTKMSHAIEPEMVAKLLNRYLEMLSQVVLDNGGILDKFVGDAVVAFWGAPISRPDDADRAARAGYAMWQAGEDFRKEVAAMDPDLPKIGKTRVGMHFGEAVVGNFGGENRIQYTALGDSMNTAARLESANKALKTSVMGSEEIASRTSLDWWRPMGSVVLSGRSSPVALFEPAPDFPKADRTVLGKALEALVSKDGHEAGLAMLEEISARHPDDEGLRALIERSHDLNDAGAHVLAGK